jgi:hypothetical protein
LGENIKMNYGVSRTPALPRWGKELQEWISSEAGDVGGQSENGRLADKMARGRKVSGQDYRRISPETAVRRMPALWMASCDLKAR